ncbi:MAG: dihydrofolate reductase [Spirochaetales bacterium]|nr:dihydrofolate reductase [Candidatus Physcosoma equi]
MKAILHCDKKWGIGKNNDLMFHLPLDMKFFRTTTKGKVVVMGGHTLLSFPNGKPLKYRTNIVLWPSGDERRAEEDGFVMVKSEEALFQELKKYDTESIFVIGGGRMYHTLLPYCTEVLVTKVDADGGAEVFFDNLDEMPNWTLTEEGEPLDDNGYTIRFCTYRNNEPKSY